MWRKDGRRINPPPIGALVVIWGKVWVKMRTRLNPAGKNLLNGCIVPIRIDYLITILQVVGSGNQNPRCMRKTFQY